MPTLLSAFLCLNKVITPLTSTITLTAVSITSSYFIPSLTPLVIYPKILMKRHPTLAAASLCFRNTPAFFAEQSSKTPNDQGISGTI